MKTALLCFLAGLAGLLAAPRAPAQEPGAVPAYPTFEPFVAERLFERLGDPHSADLPALVEKLETLARAQEAGKRAAARYGREPASAVSALLEPRMSEEQRMLASLIPFVFLRLEPLWQRATWSAEDVADARKGAEILARFPEPPRADFALGKDAENHAALEELVRWFRERAGRPEWYAAMLFTLDDGPFVGLPFEADAVLPAKATLPIDEQTTLALCRVERKREPWVLQLVRAGTPLWTRVLSGAPDESVREASFLQDAPERLGPYGWKVPMLVTWSMGREQAEVLLGPDAELLFYFLSW